MSPYKLLPHLIGLFVAVSICGCATGPKFTGPKTAHEQTALLYVFRPNNPPYACKPAIIVNKVRAANLTNKGYFDLELQPGLYHIKADWHWNSGVPDSELTLRAERGHIYYVAIDSTMHSTGFVASGITVVPIFRFDGGMGLLDSEAATSMIARCGEVRKLPGVDGQVLPQ